MKGRADFLSPKVSFDADLQIRGLALAPLAPYYEPDLPVRILRGVLSLSSEGKCHKDQLNAPSHIEIRGLEVEPKRKQILGFASNNVVESLKDKEGNVDLDIVVTGNIRSPQFLLTTKLTSAFAKGLSQALVENVPQAMEQIGKGVGDGVKSGVSKLKGLFKKD